MSEKHTALLKLFAERPETDVPIVCIDYTYCEMYCPVPLVSYGIDKIMQFHRGNIWLCKCDKPEKPEQRYEKYDDWYYLTTRNPDEKAS